jgi:hypothetical protein
MVPDFDRIFAIIGVGIVLVCAVLALVIRSLANSGKRDEIQNGQSGKPRWGCGLTFVTFLSLLLVAWAILYAACGIH